jgi:hypothetical protein
VFKEQVIKPVSGVLNTTVQTIRSEKRREENVKKKKHKAKDSTKSLREGKEKRASPAKEIKQNQSTDGETDPRGSCDYLRPRRHARRFGFCIRTWPHLRPLGREKFVWAELTSEIELNLGDQIRRPDRERDASSDNAK